jgi:hypothetical protein
VATEESVFAENACIETSPFAVVVWYTYRNKRTVKISSLIRAIVEQATAYFILIVVMQMYIQVDNVVKVRPPPPPPAMYRGWLKDDIY